MFVIAVLLMITYGNYTEVSYGEIIAQNVFVKFLSRIWQGKSVVASIGIPIMFVTLFDFYDESYKYSALDTLDKKIYQEAMVVRGNDCIMYVELEKPYMKRKVRNESRRLYKN